MAEDFSGYPVEKLCSVYVTFNTRSSLSEAVTLITGTHLFAALYIFIVWMIKLSETTKTIGLLRFYADCHNSKILQNGSNKKIYRRDKY